MGQGVDAGIVDQNVEPTVVRHNPLDAGPDEFAAFIRSELTRWTEVTRAGGIVQQLIHSLVVSTRPDNIPNSLELDISDMTLDGELRVRDLVLPAGVTTDADLDDVVAQGLITSAGAAAEGGEAPTESVES